MYKMAFNKKRLCLANASMCILNTHN